MAPVDAAAPGGNCIAFRTRAVVWAGAADLVLGLTVLALAGLLGPRDPALAAAVGVVGLLGVYAAAGRLAARVEVRPDRVVWTWDFTRREVPYDEVVDVALERTGPAPGFRCLVLVRRAGPPVRVEPVGTFGTADSSPVVADQRLIEWAVGEHRARLGAALSSS
ncbi:MAG: hypothetical protein KGJ77_04825 [Acidobacteriota bacterium]|nr:hypothetical protein [Acidobacteriota bacterium]